MLWKLLKYDFRSMWKQFSIIWPAALVIALINRFTLDGRFRTSDVGETASTVMVFLFTAVLTAMFVVALIFIIQRFYKGLLGDEGYLMHTLPVKSWQLVASKLLCAVCVTIVNMIVAGLAMFLLLPMDWSELFQTQLWRMLFWGLAEHRDTILYLAEFCLLALAGLVLGITMLYLSMAIGHLFSRRRVLMSVAAFFAIEILGGLLTNFLDELGLMEFLYHLTAWSSHAQLWMGILACLVPAALMFLGTSYILKNRLNLE